MSLSRDEIVQYILDSKKTGKKKEEIFEDLVDNIGVDGISARVYLESVRW